MNDDIEAALERFYERLAREYCGIETLTPRGRDSLDFHDVGVVSLRRALEAAFNEGREFQRVLERSGSKHK